ncbi:stage III sporulation protein AB [Gracilibacillus boraciitolerans JCM 21714]|uniref:Stage III sporulation protein AB n=1 Tax=Gracilibacillus boraciitolerans JCM 21714 TaxID=1298598 RepID=W4VDH6_9BACI|nr:stage III sporulation protein SpoIIIAB [Gracilibacillus boraciitolerans]GAE91236.1 stage III sporulation protein AB [Gracilibacillus boraciitolerans JCM 21714]
MKWIASIVLIFSLTLLGHEYAKNLANRPKLIRLFKTALQILEAEIVYSHATIREALISVTKQTPEPISNLFLHIAKDIQQEKEELFPIWEKHMEDFHKNSSIQKDDAEILNQFGRTLGQYDIYQQQKYVRLTITHLERNLVEAEEKHQRYGNMSRSIGFLTGMLIVLLLL